jgi:hypothetical protein
MSFSNPSTTLIHLGFPATFEVGVHDPRAGWLPAVLLTYWRFSSLISAISFRRSVMRSWMGRGTLLPTSPVSLERRLLQPRVFGLGSFQDLDVGIGVFPEEK